MTVHWLDDQGLILSRGNIFVIANMSTSSTGFVQPPIHCLPLPVSSFWVKLIDACWYRTYGALQSHRCSFVLDYSCFLCKYG